MRQNLQSGLGHEEGVLPLGGGQFVLGDDGPAISTVDEDLPSAHIDHRLDGEHHARDEEHTRAFLAVVQHFWIVMELNTYTVAAEVSHYAEAVFVGMLLNGITDVANEAERLGGLHAYVEAFLGHIHQFLLAGRSLADDIHTGSIGIIAI